MTRRELLARIVTGSMVTMLLCEIDVSSVAPYPESAVRYIIDAMAARIQAARQNRELSP